MQSTSSLLKVIPYVLLHAAVARFGRIAAVIRITELETAPEFVLRFRVDCL